MAAAPPSIPSGNQGAAKARPKYFSDIKAVQIDGAVLLKLIKYCGESSTHVSGRLLGLQHNNVLEITNCFAHYNNDFSHTMNGQALKLMEEIRQDSFVVGWYLSSINGNYLNGDTIDKQFQLQSEFDNSVCIVYDPTFSKNGRLVIRAFRLTDKFMAYYKNEMTLQESGKFGPTSIGKFDINSHNIFEEKAIQLHCSHLVHSFLFEIQKNKSLQNDFDRLHHKHSQSLLNNLKQLSNHIENYSHETAAFRQFYNQSTKVKYERENYVRQLERDNQKLKSRGLRTKQMLDLEKLFPSVPEKSRIDSVILNSQMNQFTKEVESSTMQGLAKLWITQGIHQNKKIDS